MYSDVIIFYNFVAIIIVILVLMLLLHVYEIAVSIDEILIKIL